MRCFKLFFGSVISLLFLFNSCEPSLLLLSGEKAASFEVRGDKAYVNGVLGKKAHKNFLKIMEEHPEIKTLVLQQMPGSMNDKWNVKTCAEIYNRGLNTYLESTSQIESGAVDLYISGRKRFAHEGAKIGVHSWRDGEKDGSEYPPEAEEHQIFYDFFETINRDTSFYWFTLRVAAGKDIYYMTKEEIDRYEVVTDWQ